MLCGVPMRREGMVCVPAAKALRRMGDDALAAVERFVVSRSDLGEIQFLQVPCPPPPPTPPPPTMPARPRV